MFTILIHTNSSQCTVRCTFQGNSSQFASPSTVKYCENESGESRYEATNSSNCISFTTRGKIIPIFNDTCGINKDLEKCNVTEQDMEEYASKVWQHCVSSSVALMETGNVKPESIDIIVTAPSTINNQERLTLQKVAKTLLNGVPTVRVLTTQQLIPQNSSNEVVVDLSRSQNLTVTSEDLSADSSADSSVDSPALWMSTKSFNDILKVFCRELDGGASDFSWGSELTAMVTRREVPWDCLSKCLHQHCAPRNNTEEVFDEDKDAFYSRNL